MPTLVQVERDADTRVRREVVGRMLNYLANGACYWSGVLLWRSPQARWIVLVKVLREGAGE
ncbi:hypothetical protein [Streptomyces decoyicus]|uniref:hypothetical protein n=1 Tax=Streptomyces decoyicus TaxID=249567 RepID=UPI0004AB4BC8|nr:hypothetical protein [Streptomyces decoyicus]KOG37546.1 hypothetical protein ADK74_35805 [Streptomyces decoyicus]QZY14825.1 hypothetical protein K7C20_05860 [Streptomyces decoyicus]